VGKKLVESTILMVNADSALVSWAHSRIETEHAAFVITLAHQASSVSSLRMLDTGLAKDVSGVLRITTSDKTISDHWDESKRDEKEVLYLVKDGLVEVFNRGQMCA
jgi:elongator complex protein 6